MNDIARQFRCQQRHPDALHEIQCNLHRAKERRLLERLSNLRLERLPESETKEELLDLRSQTRRHFDFTLKI